MTVLLAALSGLGLGYLLERGDLCFHSALRGLFRLPRRLDLLRAYVLAVLVAAPLVWGLRQVGWVAPWIPPFNWAANITGGLLFGIGMVVAATCITGLFYKLGHGMLGTLVALATWAAGDILTYYGPLAPLRGTLTVAPITAGGQPATLTNLFGPAGWLLTGLMGIAAAVWLAKSPRPSREPLWGWPRLGLAVGLFTGLAWLLAQAGGSDYTYGTSGVPTSLFLAVTQGRPLWSPWITVALISLIPGAFAAAVQTGTLWVRGETMGRYAQLAGGGFLMGVGAAIAGGCNLGHSLVGVPLLSLGSMATTLAMAAGVGLAHWAGQRLVG